MESPEQTGMQHIDRTKILVEVRAITQPRLEVPPLYDTERRTATVSDMLRRLLKDTQDDQSEAVRVMRRLGSRLLDEQPQADVTPYGAWQHLLNLARCTEAFLDIELRRR